MVRALIRIATSIFAMGILLNCSNVSVESHANGGSAAVVGRSGVIGTAIMSEDRVITITYDPSAYGHESPPLIVRPGDRDYQDHLDLLGGLEPGQQKEVFRYAGIVQMNEDRTLTVTGQGGPHVGAQVYRPGEPSYDALLKRIGGLEPGHIKGLPEVGQ